MSSRTLFRILTAVTLLASCARGAPVVSARSEHGNCPRDHVSGCRYIIMMHPSATGTATTHQEDLVTVASTTTLTPQEPTWLHLLLSTSSTSAPSDTVRTASHHSTPIPPERLQPVSVGDLVWYSATMDPATADRIQQQQHKHQIKYLIPDLPVTMYGRVQKHPPSWGLDRIDQRTDQLDGQYHYPPSGGQNVTIYVIDTGVNIDHKDFGGRAQHGPVFLPGSEDAVDKNGHGTFVAALVAGSSYGVAKKAQIVSLKALDNEGAGRLSNVLAAIEWVVKRHVAQGPNARSIINLSLGAEHNDPTNDAIQEAMKLGIHFSIAAGNDGKDACQFSPASTPGALTVGATDKDDTIASYSNYGPCVSIYAPGTNIVSAWTGSASASHMQSGSSMAAPHVAGLIALILSESPEHNIPVKVMADTILASVTKFSLNGQLVKDKLSASTVLSASSGGRHLEQQQGQEQDEEEQGFHGKTLARNLVYIGAIPSHGNGTTLVEEVDVEDSTLASSATRQGPMTLFGFLLLICATILSFD